jgi:ribulose-phosphate 3-epimerase
MKLSPSFLSADFARLHDHAREVEAEIERFHWDVMDAHFVPNLTFGPPVVNALRRRLDTPFDIHLMIDDPISYAPQFDARPDDSITFHVESDCDPSDAIKVIRGIPALVGISLRPGTPLDRIVPYLDQLDLVLVMSVEPGFGGQSFLPDALDRIRNLREAIAARPVQIAVDGGIGLQNIRTVVEAGADILIAGSAIFGQPDPAKAARRLREAAGRR